VTALHVEDGYLAIASYRPQWFRNLLACPDAEIQDGFRRYRVQARVTRDAGLRDRFRSFYPALTRIESDAEAGSSSGQRAADLVPLVRLTVESGTGFEPSTSMPQ
jgi:hypothetical protein